MKSTNDVRHGEFLKHLTRNDSFGEGYGVLTRFTVAAEWMRSSVQNAAAALAAEGIEIKGFRPGKAPKHLVEKRVAERARELGRAWVINDLSDILANDQGMLILAEPAIKDGPAWADISSDLTVAFHYKAWAFPRLDLEAVRRYLAENTPSGDGAPLRSQVFQYLSTQVIPAGLEEVIFDTTSFIEAAPGEEELAKRHLREAIADLTVARSLGITVDQTDLDKAYGELAIEQAKSLLEVQEEIEPDLELFIQQVEAKKSYTALEKILSER